MPKYVWHNLLLSTENNFWMFWQNSTYRNKTKEQEVGEKISILRKMYLTINENEMLAEKVKEYPALFNKTV